MEPVKKNNILIIAVDKLPSFKLQCNDEATDSYGFEYFCDEAVRFTHAYTPSVMSQATMASLLTSKYPYEHAIWHNGKQFLSEENHTLAEVAYEQGYKTAFFTGGGVIWRKSGFAQGFEVFEENVKFDLQNYYRSASETFRVFSKWLSALDGRNFFSILYIPDLIFEKTPTYNDLGLIRESSYNGQLNEINESLNWLIVDLKKKKLWDSSYIVLLGLNGISLPQRLREFRPYDLHSENTQVTLFVKPPHKKRDRGISWKIDKNVSLVDLSYSFFKFFGVNRKQENTPLKLYDILPDPEVPEVQVPTKRPIIIESGWPQWRGLSNTRVAIRYDNYLYLNNITPVLFNTLIDRLEAVPNYLVSKEQNANLPLLKEISKGLNLEPWRGIKDIEIEKLKLGKEIWFNPRNTNIIKELKQLREKKKEDLQTVNWLAHLYVKNHMWRELFELGKNTSNLDWQFIANLNLGRPVKDIPINNPCLIKSYPNKVKSKKIAKGRRDIDKKICKSDLLDDLFLWANSKASEKEKYREQFLRNYRFHRIDMHLYEINYMTDLNLDFSMLLPKEPEILDLILTTKKYGRMRRFVKKRVPLYPYEE